MRRSGLVIALAFLLGLPAVVHAVPIGYSISDANQTLYQIDLATGRAIALGVIPYMGEGEELEGLTAVGSRILAASESNNGTGFMQGTLWDVTTAPGARIGSTGPRFGTEAGLGYNPRDGFLYNINADDLASPIRSALYRINPATGATTTVGFSTIYADGLGINAAGEVFASDFRLTDSLYRVNLTTGALTLVGGFGIGDVAFDSGLDFDQDGTLWALTEDGSIYTVNTSSGAASFVAFVTVNGVRVPGDLEGLAIAPVPEPSTLAMGGIGALTLAVGAWRRRRKTAS